MNLPWDDCKVAFGIDDPDVLNDSTLEWPDGWELDEIDSTGARYVAVFRVSSIAPNVQDGKEVMKRLKKAGAIAKSA